MDKQTKSQSEIEYVEAEPIGEEAPPALQPMPHSRPHAQSQVHYQTSGGCVPCCGPIGCATIIMVLLLLFGSADFAKPLMYALAIFVVVSTIGGMVAKGRRG